MTDDDITPMPMRPLIPGEWVGIGDVTSSNAELLIIAAHTRPAPPDVPWTHLIAYDTVNRMTDPGPGRAYQQLVVDMLGGTGPDVAPPGHTREDAIVINTQKPHVWGVEALSCEGPDGYPVICELRIRIHEHEHDGEDEQDDDTRTSADGQDQAL
ncbi:MAG: hypothetical protein ACRDRJ_37300 [Streptosporangiaceae bacterium]